jgi:dihydrodipicolinate synthase/N-acetylneuraminate lyase
MPAALKVVVPALVLRADDGAMDTAGMRRYARAGVSTWVDCFILSGSTTHGHLLTVDERAEVLDIWLDLTEPARLLASCWEPADAVRARERNVTIMAPMRALDSDDHSLAFLHTLPAGSFVYSHPLFGGTTFDARLATAARRESTLPAGGKLAKVSSADIRAIREAVGDAFTLWDGSSRRIRASLEAGATGVVATPLCAFDTSLPPKDMDLVQAMVDLEQARLDALPDRAARTAELQHRAARRFSCSLTAEVS